MNLVEKKLSSMPIGSSVRLTQSNGQIIEGILSDNDKTTALEVTITAKVTLMYSQVTGIEENNALGKGVTLVPISTDVITQSNNSAAIKVENTKEEKKLKRKHNLT